MKIKWYKIVVWISVAVVGLFFLFAVWYKFEYAMEPVAPYSVNVQQLDTKLLIATQGSSFKNNLTQSVLDYYKADSLFIKVIDVSMLNEIETEDYKAILVMHTWEYGKPPEAVQSFMDENSNSKNKMVVLTTSGEGSESMKDVDAISGESVLENAPDVEAKIIARLNRILATQN